VRTVIAVLIGLVIAGVGFGTLRGLARPAPGPRVDDAVPVIPESAMVVHPEVVRVVFRCENCGTELLLLTKGTDAAPRHCGEHMTRREDVRRA
jgi:DNA-directed RNA polymerase subunit RPC12/RpoP